MFSVTEFTASVEVLVKENEVKRENSWFENMLSKTLKYEEKYLKDRKYIYLGYIACEMVPRHLKEYLQNTEKDM